MKKVYEVTVKVAVEGDGYTLDELQTKMQEITVLELEDGETSIGTGEINAVEIDWETLKEV